MSKDFGERMAKLEQSVSDMKIQLNRIETKLEELPKELDTKYASKLTEKIVYGMVGIILASFATLILFKIGWK